MEVTLACVEQSSFTAKLKTELKALVQKILDLQQEERRNLKEIADSKSGINEKQHFILMSQATTEQRDEILTNQFAYRAWFVNAVLRLHELRRALKSLTEQLEARVVAIDSHKNGKQKVGVNEVAKVAMLKLARNSDYSLPDGILSELDRVGDVSRARILESVIVIFSCKKNGKGPFAIPNFTSSMLQFAEPTPAQTALASAVQPAIAIRAKFEDLYFAFTAARRNYDLTTFNRDLEQAHLDGKAEKIGKIARQKADAEAAFFVAAYRYAGAYSELWQVADTVKAAIELAAKEVEALKHPALVISAEGLATLKSMSNCIGAWHHLGELVSYNEEREAYIDGKYRDCDPEKVLRELNFDSAAYLAAQAATK